MPSGRGGGGGRGGAAGGRGGNPAGAGGRGGPKPQAQSPKQSPNKPQGKKGKDSVEIVTPGAAKSSFTFQPPKDQPAGGFQFNFQAPTGDQSSAFSMEDLKESAVDPIASLPPAVQEKVKDLKKLQEERDQLFNKFEEERRALELKYEALYAPIYDKRAAAVAENNGEAIPDFWLKAMKHFPLLEELIQPRDEPALKALKDIRVKMLENENFALEFHFDANPYFEDQVLTKTFFLTQPTSPAAGWEFDHSEGTKINWKPEKNLSVNIVKKKQKKKGNRPARVKTSEEPCATFFNIFDPPKLDAEQVKKLDQEELEELQAQLQDDFELGLIMKDTLVPYAVLCFTGELELDDDDEFDYDFDDEDDEDDEDGFNSEDEDEDNDGNDSAVASSGGAPAQPAECKQQ